MRLTPNSLFGRFLLIIIIPMIVLQLVITVIFYQRHWENVTEHMQDALIGEIKTVINIAGNHDINQKVLKTLVPLKLNVKVIKQGNLEEYAKTLSRLRTDYDLRAFENRLKSNMTVPGLVRYLKDSSSIIAGFEVENNILEIEFSSKRIRSPTTNVFMVWMIAVATLLIFISVVFMRNQVKSITHLAEVADSFGKGQDIEYFKPTGAKEIRTAGYAFIKMKQRIERQIKYRTELLAHISHDLRTPLTRLKLQVAMLEDKSIAEEISHDLVEMEEMISCYLDFAKGEGNEEVKEVEVLELLMKALAKFNDPKINFKPTFKEQQLFLRPNAFQRAINNVIENALKYSKSKIDVLLTKTEENIYITIDDDGKGIDAALRKVVFKPFQKLNESKEGYGLGLAIVKSIIQAHGGKIKLAQSPYNGLRVIMIFPI